MRAGGESVFYLETTERNIEQKRNNRNLGWDRLLLPIGPPFGKFECVNCYHKSNKFQDNYLSTINYYIFLAQSAGTPITWPRPRRPICLFFFPFSKWDAKSVFIP